MIAKVLIGLIDETEESANIRKDVAEPHYRCFGQRKKQPAAFRIHASPAIANALNFRQASLQCPKEIGTMQIATGFAGTEKDVHERHPCQKSEVRSQK